MEHWSSKILRVNLLLAMPVGMRSKGWLGLLRLVCPIRRKTTLAEGTPPGWDG
jgi:hypothetical protein